ncbi:MAG: hypothetical protein CL916_10070 [Deltaproteobacteria bacterium]|nr:hypothetical protein [Deltaproteobacteria bacterium]
MLLLFLGCASQSNISEKDTPVPSDGENGEHIHAALFSASASRTVMETLAIGQTLSSIHSHTLFYSDNDEIYLQREPEAPAFVTQGKNVQAHSFQESILITVDGTLYIQSEDEWSISPLSQINGHTTESILSTQENLFLFGAGQLHSWTDGTTRQISITDHTILDVALHDTSVLIRTPKLYQYNTETKETSTLWDKPVSSLAVDGNQTIWFAHMDTLYRKDTNGLMTSFLLPSNITDVMANPKGVGLWVQTQDTHYFYRDQEFFDIGWFGQHWLDVDEHDRLIIRSEDQLQRISIDRPTVIQGLNKYDAITTRKELILLPSNPQTVRSLQVFIAGTELNVQDSWSFQLNPDDFETGEHDIHIVQHTDEDTHLTIHPFVNQELSPVFWEDEIKPLHEENCASCHGGATETILTSKEEWIQNIDIIIDVISIQSMPLGAPPLSEEQITTIRAWKQGGFQ